MCTFGKNAATKQRWKWIYETLKPRCAIFYLHLKMLCRASASKTWQTVLCLKWFLKHCSYLNIPVWKINTKFAGKYCLVTLTISLLALDFYLRSLSRPFTAYPHPTSPLSFPFKMLSLAASRPKVSAFFAHLLHFQIRLCSLPCGPLTPGRSSS